MEATSRLAEVEETLKKIAETLEEMSRRAARDSVKLEEAAEHIKTAAEALKTAAEYMKTVSAAFAEILTRHEKVLEELKNAVVEIRKVLERHETRLEELAGAVGELKVAVGSLGRRWGRDLERTVLELFRETLERRGIEPGKVEKLTLEDKEGMFYKRGAKLEIDVYVHDGKTYLIEVKSHAELKDVEWLDDVAKVFAKVLNRKIERVILVAVHVDRDALERAKELDIDVIYGNVLE